MTKLPIALLYRAMSERQLGALDSAAELIRRALNLGLDTVDIHLEMGNTCLAQGDLSRARDEYSISRRISPLNPIAAFNHGFVLRKLGDLKGAAMSYEAALKLHPAFREPALELAVLFIQENRIDDALRLLEGTSKTDAIALSLKGAAHLQKRNLDEAQRHLEAALKVDRSLVDARKNLAQLYLLKGDPARAARYMHSSAPIPPVDESGGGKQSK
jgi:Flp pilus assembly protein TadD